VKTFTATTLLSKGFTGVVRGSTGRITRLRLGKHTLEGVITSFPDKESCGKAGVLGQNGMIGNDVLKRFFVAIDGRPVGDLTDDEIWDAFTRDGARLLLTIERGDKRLERSLVLRRMI
jgi:hypothetical protein